MTFTPHVTDYPARESHREAYLTWLSASESLLSGRKTPIELLPFYPEKRTKRVTETQRIRDSI